MSFGGSTFGGSPFGAEPAGFAVGDHFIAAVLDDITAAVSVEHIPYTATIAATLDDITASVPVFHDWEKGDLPPNSQRIYILTLTPTVGDAVNIPMSSWQSTTDIAAASYVSSVIPNPDDYADEIAAATGGIIEIYKGYRLPDGTELLSLIADAEITTIRIDAGPRSASASISGYSVRTASAPKTRAANGERYISTSNGERRVRADVDLFLQPGDTLTYSGGSFTVRSINYIVGPRSEQMEAQE